MLFVKVKTWTNFRQAANITQLKLPTILVYPLFCYGIPLKLVQNQSVCVAQHIFHTSGAEVKFCCCNQRLKVISSGSISQWDLPPAPEPVEIKLMKMQCFVCDIVLNFF